MTIELIYLWDFPGALIVKKAETINIIAHNAYHIGRFPTFDEANSATFNNRSESVNLQLFMMNGMRNAWRRFRGWRPGSRWLRLSGRAQHAGAISCRAALESPES